MALPPLKLSRKQLSTFLKDHEQIVAFENLFRTAELSAPDIVEAATNAAASAEVSANEALAQLARIADALEVLAAAPVTQHNNSVVTDYIDVAESAPAADSARRLQWNGDDGTLDIGLYGGSVLQVGQETHFYAKNTSGSTIANGSPCMITGGTTGKLTFSLADADGSVAPEYMMGVATQSIANDAFGYVTAFGLVRGFDTTGTPYGQVWAAGNLIYFDPVTPGNWTNVEPAAPNIRTPAAIVVDASAAGSVFVRMKVGSRLTDIQDVFAPGPIVNGQLIMGDAAQSRFEAGTLTAGTNIAISNGPGSITVATTASITSDLTNNTGRLVDSSVNLTNGAAAAAGTLLNAPVAGNPTKWIPIDDNGTTRYIPAW
jgi:hypothetical protein